ncbi:hypothetical protein T484DRAFT_1902825 [Baffinella frigidus]|nr:hypothetical protein T484DRAFT_1902825 [Cryptophyta sp. CCMP2293]
MKGGILTGARSRWRRGAAGLFGVVLLCQACAAPPVEPSIGGAVSGLVHGGSAAGGAHTHSPVSGRPPVSFERQLRKDGPAECRVCTGMTNQTTRCPRCLPSFPPLHAICEEEWLMRHGLCMFCRLPVRRKNEARRSVGTLGAAPLWSYRSERNKDFSQHLVTLRHQAKQLVILRQQAKGAKSPLVPRLAEAAARPVGGRGEPRVTVKDRKRSLETLWRRFAGGKERNALDELSICGALEILAGLYGRMVGRVEGVIRLMEGRAISQALQAIARLKASSATAGPAGAAGAAATARATAGVAKAPGVAATGAAAAGALKVDFDGLVVALSRRGAVGHIAETFYAAEIAQSLFSRAVGHIVETFFAAEIAQSLAALGRLGVPADDDLSLVALGRLGVPADDDLVEALSVRAATEGIFKGTDARNLVELVQGEGLGAFEGGIDRPDPLLGEGAPERERQRGHRAWLPGSWRPMGLATLGVTPAKWAPALDQIAQAVTAQLYSLNQDDVADLLEAYGKVGYRSEWLLVRSAARIMTPVFLARIAPRHVAKVTRV